MPALRPGSEGPLLLCRLVNLRVRISRTGSQAGAYHGRMAGTGEATLRFWEALLAPGIEEIYIRFLEDCAEERYFAGWTNQALTAAYEQAPEDIRYLRLLLQAARDSLLEYLEFLRQAMELLCEELEVRGKDYDAGLRNSPEADLEARVAKYLARRMELDGAPTPSIARIDRESFAHEYASLQIEEFLSRFNGCSCDIPSQFPRAQWKALKARLIETRRELKRRIGELEDLRDAEVDRVWEEQATEEDRAWLRESEARDEQASARDRLRLRPCCPDAPHPIRPPLRSKQSG
jgi:hypothetical protein